jgi:hypothetical protein
MQCYKTFRMSFPTKVDMPNHSVTLLRTPVFEETYLGQGKNLPNFVRKCELLPGGGATSNLLWLPKSTWLVLYLS